MNRRMQRRVYGLAGAMALNALFSPRICAQAQETPQTANRFCDSVGINLHLWGGAVPNTPYVTNFQNNVNVPLSGLGIRHIRDWMAVDNPGGYFSELQTLGNEGIKCDLSINPLWHYANSDAVTDSWNDTTSYLLGCQEAVEGANEIDSEEGSTAPWQQNFNIEWSDIWSKYRGSQSTAGIKIYSGTIIDSVAGDTAGYVNGTANSPAYGTVSSKVDFGNTHPYCYSRGNPDANLATEVGERSALWGNSGPFVITETGYYTGTGTYAVTPVVQSKYTLRTLFGALNIGAYRTYLYELCDEGSDTAAPEQNFGLINYDGSDKPAYNALFSVMSLLADSSTSTAVTPLTWSLGGNIANVKHTLLQKSDGSYYLALWLGVPSSDSAVSQGVTVTVPSTIASGSLYTINQYGSMPAPSTVTITNGQMSFNVTDSVSVLKLTGPIVESTPLALSQPSVSRNGGTVTATVTFQNVSSAAMTILPYIGARDASGNNVDFGSGGYSDITLQPGQTVSVSAPKTLSTGLNTGTWSVFGSYRTSSDGYWYSLSPNLSLTVTN